MDTADEVSGTSPQDLDNLSEDSRRPDSIALQLTTIHSLSELYLTPAKLNLNQNLTSVQKLFLPENNNKSSNVTLSRSPSKSLKFGNWEPGKRLDSFQEDEPVEEPDEEEEEDPNQLTINTNPNELLDQKSKIGKKKSSKKLLDDQIGIEPRSWYQKIRAKVYRFLNQPQTAPSIFYHILLFTIMAIYAVVVITTDKVVWQGPGCSVKLDPSKFTFRMWFEHCLVIFCAGSFIIRLWSSRSLSEYSNISTVSWLTHYFRHPSHMFDLVLFFASLSLSLVCWAPFSFELIQDIYTLLALRVFHRLYTVAQWSTVQTRQSPWKLMGEVFSEQGPILFGLFYLELALIVTMAYSVYMVETHHWSTVPVPADKEVPISDLVDALYWASITLATIGFGDLAPITDLGKFISVVCLMIGMALYALPSGIIATSLAIKISHNDEIRERRKQRDLAARLIQKVWRLARRDKRFQLARMLWTKHQSQQATQQQATQQQVRNVPKRLKLERTLQKRIEKIVKQSAKYYACRFILLTQFEMIRNQFVKTCTARSAANLRMTQQAIDNDYRKLMTSLEYSQTQLSERASLEQTLNWIENKLEEMVGGKLESKLETNSLIDTSKTIGKHQMG